MRWAACACACNTVYGLDETTTSGDADGDGDAIDNCRLDENADQANDDFDAFGTRAIGVRRS